MLLPASQYVGASAFAWPAALFLWGPGSRTDLHRHHCVQLVMALDGTLSFRQRPRQRWSRCAAVLVRPDAWHEVNARETDVLIAFVDPESELGVALVARTGSDVAPIPPATVAEWRTQLGEPTSLTGVRVEPWVTGTLLRDRRPSSIDHRVKRVLRELPNRLAEAEAVSLNAIAASVRLSPSRFLHRRLSAFRCVRMSFGCACSAGPGRSRAASPLPKRRMQLVSRMLRTSPARFVE